MNKKNKSPDNADSKNHNKFTGWKKIVTSVALIGTLNACGNMSNNEIKLDPENQSARFKVEYQYYEWASSIGITNYDIIISKQWNNFVWEIKKSKWRTSETTRVESDNLHTVFEQVSKSLYDPQTTDKTMSKKDAKVKFVEKAFEDYILNGKSTEPTTLEYKK